MGDSDNAAPASKKRAAGRQITQLDPEIDDDTPDLEMGTFKKASEEVLATRRIVKVRRQQPQAAPSSNPFAGISLLTTTDSSAKATITSVVDEEVPEQPRESSDKPEKVSEIEESKKLEDVTDASEGVDKPKSEDVKNDGPGELNSDAAKDTKKDSEEEKEKVFESKTEKVVGEETDKERLTDNPKSTAEPATPVNSFQQLSSSQNAFTGLTGSGFSASSFSFGSKLNSGSVFGSKNGSETFSLGTGSSNSGDSSFQLFGTAASDTNKNGGATSIPPMQEVPVETGEENEKAVFSSDAVLYEYLDGSWKERGKGELKVNISVSGAEKARLVMRARGNYRLILNASLYPDMTLTNMDKRGVTFACVNSAGEGKSGLTTFALKFRDSTFMEEFRGVVTLHKGKAAAALKTPENSPKASDD